MTVFSRSFFIIFFTICLFQTGFVSGEEKRQNRETTKFPTATEPPIEASICPEDSTISPCICWAYPGLGTTVQCSGATVTQTRIDNSFRELRRVNAIPEDRRIYIYRFALEETNLTQLDLAPLYKSQMDYLHIHDNYKLTKWLNSGQLEDHGSIHVDSFSIRNGPIINGGEMDMGFGDTFTYFSNDMTRFYANNLTITPNPNANPIEQNNPDESQPQGEIQIQISRSREFLPGLSTLTNLTRLHMNSCNITGRLTRSDFKQFPKLQYISLQYNKIEEIEENVFSSEVENIDLNGNSLSETSIHPNSGIVQIGHQVRLWLAQNQVTSLPSEIFQPFLDAHLYNSVNLHGNPLICDEKLSWIKSRREEFQSKVAYAQCSNDEGHTVFDSDLIP